MQVLLIYEGARNNFFSILILISDSRAIIASIFGFVAVYSFLGYFIFKNSLEGYSFFSSPGVGLYELFITFTTSNFPNVMLPAYY